MEKRSVRLFDRRSVVHWWLFAVARNLLAESPREVLGITLRPAGGRLLEHVEKACGKSIIARQTTLTTNMAEGGIRGDGTPVIEVSPNVTVTEELLVHELSHMKLQIEGFPKVFFRGSADVTSDDALLTWLRSNVLDVIQHRIFYPRLRRMGYAPDAARIAEIRLIIERGNFIDVSSVVDLASKYFRIIMEVANTKVISSVNKWYRERGWSDALAVANDAYSRVGAIVEWTPQTELEAFVACANALLRGRYVIAFLGMESERHGSVTQRYGDLVISRAG
jgi:hypothetical protein